MARSAVLPIRGIGTEANIFSNKSSLILFWLLSYQNQISKDGFSINEIGRLTGTSIGLVHKVVKQLEYIGVIASQGLRTNKRFHLKSPDKLLISWVQEYNIIKKAKSRGFSFAEIDASSIVKFGLVPALHTSSGNFFKLKVTNLRLQEYYVSNWLNLSKITDQLKLQEIDRGYEILLIKPYYSSLIEKLATNGQESIWFRPYALLTVLDLCHFPVRGVEQAEALFKKNEFMKSICSWSDIENAIG